MFTFALGGRLALVCCLALWPASALFVVGAAHADEAQRMLFDLPAQPLEQTLSDFGRLTGYSVLVDSAMTLGRVTPAVRGEFAPQDALRQLLTGTGLAARYSGRNAFTLMSAATVTFPALPAETVDEIIEPRRAPSLAGMPDAVAADFAGALQQALTKAMCAAQPEAMGRFRAALQLWVDPEGRIHRARLLESTGVKARDAHLLKQLKGLPIGRVPPSELAQPLTILLSPRPDPGTACREAPSGRG